MSRKVDRSGRRHQSISLLDTSLTCGNSMRLKINPCVFQQVPSRLLFSYRLWAMEKERDVKGRQVTDCFSVCWNLSPEIISLSLWKLSPRRLWRRPAGGACERRSHRLAAGRQISIPFSFSNRKEKVGIERDLSLLVKTSLGPTSVSLSFRRA